ncbi:MAG: acetyl-CoA carboxylase biotin carboxyl carrier protein subunit, partial [Candidatus Syntrophosphaera sp.]
PEIRAPLPGVISKIHVKEGEKVKRGQTILTLEAMKMESEISVPVDCVIGKIHVQERAPVHEGDLLMTLEDVETPERKPSKPARRKPAPPPEPAPQADNIVRAPLSGTIVELKASPGDAIERGQVLLILEAMKMESEIHSHLSGRIARIHVQKGDMVQEGDPLVELEG